MKKHIPNFLTLFRIVLVPFFIFFIFSKRSEYGVLISTIIFITASITDFYDGYLARKFNVISNFGKIMDPLADKILVAAALFALAFEPFHYISIFVVIIILFREIAVTFLRAYYSKKEIYIPANIWGKLKTTLQMIGIIFSLLYKSLSQHVRLESEVDSMIIKLISIFFWLVAIVTILSGMNYFMIKRK